MAEELSLEALRDEIDKIDEVIVRRRSDQLGQDRGAETGADHGGVLEHDLGHCGQPIDAGCDHAAGSRRDRLCAAFANDGRDLLDEQRVATGAERDRLDRHRAAVANSEAVGDQLGGLRTGQLLERKLAVQARRERRAAVGLRPCREYQ